MPNTYDKHGRVLTVPFDDTVRKNLQKSVTFRREYLRCAMECTIQGELDVAKSMLRKFIDGTVGFMPLGKALNRDPKTLMRMFSARGNPTVRNFFEIVTYLQKHEGTVIQVLVKKAA
jgi:hypothetical protein